jgi:AAHS family 4-hydroxybenzoate transporter-like MFS transporter
MHTTHIASDSGPAPRSGSIPTIQARREVHVGDVIDARPMSALQRLIVALCMLVAVLDGFDTQTIGFLAPAISADLHIPLYRFGPVFTAGLVGLMVGAILCGTLADRYGRKRVLIAATISFGACALLTAYATTLPQLMVIRFLTGVGLGGAMPNIVAIASEFSPRRLARISVTLLFCGMPAGAVLGGMASAILLPRFGWHALFFVGGALPLAVAAALAIWMPESVRYLIQRGDAGRRVNAIMRRIAPDLDAGTVVVANTVRSQGSATIRQLFTDGRAPATILLWIPYFLNLMVLYFSISWLPAVLVLNGQDVSIGIEAITAFSVGGIIGSMAQGRLMNRFGVTPVLCTEFVIYMVFVAALALLPLDTTFILACTLGAGCAVQGAQAGLNSLAAEIYPVAIRATGVGCALSVGRIGSIIGPVAGALMLAQHWNARQIFLAGMMPGAIATLALLSGVVFRRIVQTQDARRR